MKVLQFVTVEVDAHCTKKVQLERPFKGLLPNSGIPGYPETALEVEHVVDAPFKPTYIEIDSECAPHFNVRNCLIGPTYAWSVLCKPVPARILNARPEIDFPVIFPETEVAIEIVNISATRRAFRATLVGDDPESRETQKCYRRVWLTEQFRTAAAAITAAYEHMHVFEGAHSETIADEAGSLIAKLNEWARAVEEGA